MDGFRDILDARESLRRPLMGSLGLHAGVAVLIAVLGVANFAKREQWGDPDSKGGGAIGVTAVKSIPIAGAGCRCPSQPPPSASTSSTGS